MGDLGVGQRALCLSTVAASRFPPPALLASGSTSLRGTIEFNSAPQATWTSATPRTSVAFESMPERADVQFVNHLAEHGYHPRSSKHGDALCGFMVVDLLDTCPTFRLAAEQESIVFRRNFTIDPESADRWNADLVVGPPVHAPTPDDRRIGPLAQGDPREIWVAIDAKTIMTEHGKARRNRQRDLNSFQDILHRKNARTIVGGLLVVNMAESFQTPLATKTGEITQHRNVVRQVGQIVTMMGALARADPSNTNRGLEALGIVVVSHSNVEGGVPHLVVDPPAPQPGEPLSYTAFLHDLCDAFTTRFATSPSSNVPS
jgi:hypothetical protein